MYSSKDNIRRRCAAHRVRSRRGHSWHPTAAKDASGFTAACISASKATAQSRDSNPVGYTMALMQGQLHHSQGHCFFTIFTLNRLISLHSPIHTNMRKFLSNLSLVAGLVLAASGATAAPSNKCLVNSTVTYQQGTCPSDQVRKPPTIQELNANEKRLLTAAAVSAPDKVAPVAPKISSGFSCDSRQYCSQMKSCAEANYFLANCPGAKMDGDGNGIPCEKQWCGR